MAAIAGARAPSGPASGNVVIIGAGLAGLFCALRLAPLPVTVIAAAPLGEGAATAWAQGGIAAAVAKDDSAEAHARDTIAVGAGIVDEQVAHRLTGEAAARIEDLARLGVPFDRDASGAYSVSREAAHSARRVVHVGGDRAGAAVLTTLAAAVRRTPSIHVRENCLAEALVVEAGRVVGVSLRAVNDPAAAPLVIPAGAVVMATGGIGHIYQITTNPPQACGHGLAIAARAGATIADPEFVQFHPTAMVTGQDPAPLATEALRGEGAILVNRKGERFMQAIHPLAELAPRDIVARGVFAELAAGRGAFLDARAAIGAKFPQAFPTVYASAMAAGIDPVHQPIPIAPAEHYHMGGIAVDLNGRSTLTGLWAGGEVSSTGAHGGNRLASNSLLEAVVYAARIADDIKGFHFGPAVANPIAPPAMAHAPLAEAAEHGVRALMSSHVGVIRDGERLKQAIAALAHVERTAQTITLANMALTGLFVATAAWQRTESRGAHYRSDYPDEDPGQARRTMMTLADMRAIVAEAVADTASTGGAS